MASIKTDYEDIVVTIKNRVGTIKLNRPSSLNSFGGKLIPETVNAIRELNNHPDTVFTVLTGEGRFFSAGADVRANSISRLNPEGLTSGEKKLLMLSAQSPALELIRSLIDHRKVFVLALNGPGVGGGAAWFTGIADIVFASPTTYLQVPFSSLGLVPENGSALNFAQSIGVHRANDFFMFERKLNVNELENWGLVNRIFQKDGFHEKVQNFLEEQLLEKDGESMMEMKRLQNQSLREGRMMAVVNAVDALCERFVAGVPYKRFDLKRQQLEAKSNNKPKL